MHYLAGADVALLSGVCRGKFAMGLGGSFIIHTFARFGTIFLGGLLLSAVSSAGEGADLRPSWVDNYSVWSGRADLEIRNHSYLENRQVGLGSTDNVLVDQIGSLIGGQQALAWRQQYEDLNRVYEQKKLAGLTNPSDEMAHEGDITRFRDVVVTETQNRKRQESGDIAVRAVAKDPTARSILAPGALFASVWIGRPFNLRVMDDFRFTLRTNLKDHWGQFELNSSLVYGSFEYHYDAPENYNLTSSTAVDFGHALDLNHNFDFGSEKYQFRLVRDLPFIDVSSSVVYASSSNVVASSLTKKLTSNLAAVVDSIYYLAPYDPDHTTEERVRLRYDLHF